MLIEETCEICEPQSYLIVPPTNHLESLTGADKAAKSSLCAMFLGTARMKCFL